MKSRRRATRLARVQDYLSKTMQRLNDSGHDQRGSQHLPAPWGASGSVPYKCQKIQSSESLQVLTYHQIPLLPLDWNNDPPQRCETADVGDILAGRVTMTLPNTSEEKPTNDTWESKDKAKRKENSVSDVWQAFLNGPSCEDRSDLPESEWLQTAALVSPSNDRKPQVKYSAESQELQELQARTDTATATHPLAACQPLSDTCEPLSAVVAFNTKDHQPEEACVSSLGDDNAMTQAASQRSQTNSVTDTPLEFSLERALPVSRDADSTSECHEQEVWEQECGGIIVAGTGGVKPFTLHTADLVTSSRESETTDMISEGERQDEGLSSSGEREVTAAAHNAADDMLAFRETIGLETKDGVRNVFSASRQKVEEEIVTGYPENKASIGEIFRLEETKDEAEIQEAGLIGEGKEIIKISLQRICQREVLQDIFSGQIQKILMLEACGKGVQNKEDLVKEIEKSADLTSETGKHVLECNLLGDGNRLSCDGKAMEEKEISPSANFRPTVDIKESKKIFHINQDTPIGSTDKCNPNPLDVVEMRWTYSQQELKNQNSRSKISPEDDTGKKNAPTKPTSTKHQPEDSGRTEDLSQQDKSISIGKLQIEAKREMMVNAESPQMEKCTSAKLSAQVENSSIGEYGKPSVETKDPVTAVNSPALKVLEPRKELMVIERFGECFVSKIWEEIFIGEVQELPTDLNLSLVQASEQTLAAESNKCSTQNKSQREATQKTQVLFKLQTNLNSNFITASGSQIGEPLFQSTQELDSPKDQENFSQIKARSVTQKEAENQTEDRVLTRKRSLDPSSNLSNKHPNSTDKLKESNTLLWWTMFYTISHLTRLLICTILVGGFFVVVFLYDFPAFFAFYVFSVCWWVYTWKRHRVTADDRTTG